MAGDRREICTLFAEVLGIQRLICWLGGANKIAAALIGGEEAAHYIKPRHENEHAVCCMKRSHASSQVLSRSIESDSSAAVYTALDMRQQVIP